MVGSECKMTLAVPYELAQLLLLLTKVEKGVPWRAGMIFACFMVASMSGSALAGRLLSSSSK